jgi:hypothetical protein
MKFYRVYTDHNEEEIEKSIDLISEFEFEKVRLIYRRNEFIEFIDEIGNVGMFIIIDDWDKEELAKLFRKCKLSFKFVDLTKEVLMGDFINTNLYDKFGDSLSEVISFYIEDFYDDFITTDIILDKINERGMNSLTPRDLKVLDNFT